MKTVYSYPFYRDESLLKVQDVMKMFRYGFKSIGGFKAEEVLASGSGAVEYRLEGGCSVTVAPSEAEPGIEVCISVGEGRECGAGSESRACEEDERAADVERRIREDLKSIIYLDHGAAYCCE